MKIGAFDPGIRYYGGEDSELSIRAWLLGYRVICDPSIKVLHRFRSSFPYQLELSDINYNKIRFVVSHFNSERVTKYLKAIASVPQFSNLFLMVIEHRTLDRRFDLFSKR